MSTTEAIDPEPIEVMIEPKLMRWARYVVGNDGAFADRGALVARDGEAAVIELAGPPNDRVRVSYDSSTARTAAARLFGYAHQLDLNEPLPAYILATLLVPDSRTATSTTWDLGDGLVLRYTAPFEASLTAEAAEWTLTAERATRWARALLTLAAELDHAHVVARHAILAHRTGTTATENIRRWVTDLAHELTGEQRRFAERLRDVLADEERIEHNDTLFAALDVAHPELPTSLADLRLLSRETLTHLHAAEVIERLAAMYNTPFYLWTAQSRYIEWEIGDIPLSESEWRRVAATDEMNAFESIIENEQDNQGAALDIRRALHQAGVICRACDKRITGEIVTTLGHCLGCRPTDPEALAKVLAAGCPGVEDEENYTTHSLSDDGPCRHCGLPLPPDYHLVLEAEQAEGEQAQAARRAVEDRQRRVMAEARRLLAEAWSKDAEDLQKAGHDVPEETETRLLWVKQMAAQAGDWEFGQHYSSFLDAATRAVDQADADTGSDG